MIDRLEIKDSPISGKGCFAREKINKGEYIITLIGIEFTPKEIEKAISAGIISPDDPLQIENDLFLILNNPSKKINHSCNPNAAICNRNDLFALIDINIGDEITFDYSTTVGANNTWEMDCYCNNKICRKKIGNILSIPKEIRDHYSNLNLLPDFIKKQLINFLAKPPVNFSTHVIQLYLNAAHALKLPVEYYPEFSVIRVCLANKKYSFEVNITPFNDAGSSNVFYDKFLVNKILCEAGLPMPKATLISKNNYIDGTWKLPELCYPIVAKPSVNVSNGLDVLCNIQDEKALIQYLNENASKYSHIVIEKFEAGLSTYRILVFFNKVIGVTRIEPSYVIGDGQHTISDLIKIQNKKRSELVAFLKDIKIDKECYARLKEMNFTLDYIPATNEKILLSYTCTTERGGTDISLGKSICPENADLLCRAAKILNFNLAGFDIVCEDIQRPIEKTRGFIIEVNADPDITYHESPAEGTHVPIAKIFLKRLIRKHPIAYTKLYCKQILNPYSFFIRAALALSLFVGALKLLNKS